MSEFKKIKEEMAALLEKRKVEGEKFFKKAAADIFKKYPELKSFQWTQYTDYFNDGDPTSFGAHTSEITLNSGENDEVCEFSKWSSLQRWNDKQKKYEKVDESNLTSLERGGLAALDLLSELDVDDFESLFGDHKMVTVYADRVDVDDYTDHN